jgi:hypothetical protein|tara:strand:+ start:1509 stop:1748 length:240 start_codon:yes stop_codon:yes gene_type:complete
MNLNLRRLIKLFTHHPESNGETYFQHFRCASSYGLRMIFSGLAAIIHSVFPFLFETAASDCAKKINEEIDRRSQNSLIR